MVMALDVCAGVRCADMPSALQGVAFRHADAQRAVVQLMAQPNAVLVGHSLHHDLQALKIGVTPASLLCVDTSFLWGYRSVPRQPNTRSTLDCSSLQQKRLSCLWLLHPVAGGMRKQRPTAALHPAVLCASPQPSCHGIACKRRCVLTLVPCQHLCPVPCLSTGPS